MYPCRDQNVLQGLEHLLHEHDPCGPGVWLWGVDGWPFVGTCHVKGPKGHRKRRHQNWLATHLFRQCQNTFTYVANSTCTKFEQRTTEEIIGPAEPYVALPKRHPSESHLF